MPPWFSLNTNLTIGVSESTKIHYDIEMNNINLEYSLRYNAYYISEKEGPSFLTNRKSNPCNNIFRWRE